MKQIYNNKRRYTVSNDTISDDMDYPEYKNTKESSNPSNQIFFYGEITENTILNLNRQIDSVTRNLLVLAIDYNLSELPHIDLFINSDGGDLVSTLSTVDRIRTNKIPIHSYVEGVCASAASLISIVSHKRFMRQRGLMLIHQLSGDKLGTYHQMKDDQKNCDLLMQSMKNIYLTSSKLTEPELDTLLKHDIYLTAEECLKFGLIDTIL